VAGGPSVPKLSLQRSGGDKSAGRLVYLGMRGISGLKFTSNTIHEFQTNKRMIHAMDAESTFVDRFKALAKCFAPS
jgi:hypothetical protein